MSALCAAGRFFYLRKGYIYLNKFLETNYRIRDKEVRVVDAEGELIGIMSAKEANSLADQKNLDLVKISPNAKPPVCKIMDYGKYKFEMNKRDKEAKKNQVVSELKEVWLSMTIDKHDLETKARHAKKFIQAGNKVKVQLRMRGRQQAHANLGVQVLAEFYAFVEDISIQDKKPSTEGRSIVMILSPKKANAAKGTIEKKPNAATADNTVTNNAIGDKLKQAQANQNAKPKVANNANKPATLQNTPKPKSTNNPTPPTK